MANKRPTKRGPSRIARILAMRDQEILSMARRGRTQADIAARLGLSPSLVFHTLQRLRGGGQQERNDT